MIRLSEAQRETIRRHGVEAFPLECCGVLLGDVEEGAKIVREARPLPNTFEPSAEFEASGGGSGSETVGQERRYMVSPDTMFALMQEERRTKRKVLGFYHTHPNHPAQPSVYDREWASAWYSYIILSVRNGEPAEMTCWTLDDDRTVFHPETMEVS